MPRDIDEARRQCDVPIHPIPRGGPARIAWFEQLSLVIAADAAETNRQLVAEGWPASALDGVLTHYRDWAASWVIGSVDGYIAEQLWRRSHE